MARQVKGTLFKRGRMFWCKFKFQNVLYRFSLKTAKPTHAQHELERLMLPRRAAIEDNSFDEKFGQNHAQSTPKSTELLLSGIWERYLKSVHRRDSGETTLKQYGYQVGHFVSWMSKRYPAVKRFRDVTKQMAAEFAGEIRAEMSSGTFNKYKNALRMVYHVLGNEVGLVENPWDGITTKNNNPNSRRSFTRDELGKIFQTAEGEVLTLCLLGYHTALRLGDCCLLEWREVDLVKKIITRVPLKTSRTSGRVVIVPISPALLEHVRSIRRTAASIYVCPRMADMYGRGSSAVGDRFQNLFKRCGIKILREGTGKGTGKRAIVEVGFHSFRHTWVTEAAQKNVDSASIRAVAGWGSPAMEKIYTHISPEHLAQQMGKMNSVAGSTKVAPQSPVDVTTEISDGELQQILHTLQHELDRRKSAEKKGADSLNTAVPA